MHEMNLEKMRSVARPEMRHGRKKIGMGQERDEIWAIFGIGSGKKVGASGVRVNTKVL
jgi:hypothetical protein